MKTILTLIAAVLIVYLLFVALNTYIYAEKQGDGGLLNGSATIQWGF